MYREFTHMARNAAHRLLYACITALAVFSATGTATADQPSNSQSRGITMQTTQQLAQTPYAGGTYRALIIGNDHYTDDQGRWRPLQTAVSDAHAVKDLLKTYYGFEDVTLLENATRRDVLVALDALSRRAMSDDSILIYYAGHGFMDEETRKGYWVPVDASGEDHTTFLRNSTIRDELSTIASRARHTLLLSDSCFSGSLLRSATRGISATPSGEKYYKKVADKKSVQIVTAGGVEYVDDDYGDSGHSPFTYFLLNELKTNDRPMLTVSELSNNVARAVANNVEQVPESGILAGAGDEMGEFIFIKLDVAVEGIAADKVKVKVNVIPAEKEVINTAPAPDRPSRDFLPIPTM